MDMGVEMESEQQRMEREAKEKADADDGNQGTLPPPPMRPLMEQNFMQYMQMMQENQNKFMEELLGRAGNQRAPEGGGVSLSNFQNARPLPFASAPKPMDAEDCLEDTERKLKTVGCNDEEKVRYATHLLTGPAASWWESHLPCNNQEGSSPGRSLSRDSVNIMFRRVLWS